MDSGRILIDKPSGMSSFGVVARVRRYLSQQMGHKVKVGHTGTLDPFATGLMIIFFGSDCKKASEYSKLDKTYETTIILGQTSSTGDIEGELIKVSDKKPSEVEIHQVLTNFIGEITQMPPIYSAIKINGQRAYKLARAGELIEMPKRQVKVYDLELLSYDYPELSIRAEVSSGTYIRTLAQDIGSKLNTGAYCRELRRTTVGEYSVKNAKKLDEYLGVG